MPSVDDEPLTAEHPEIPAEHALQGFDGVCAYASNPEASRSLLEETLGFSPAASSSGRRGATAGALRLPRGAREPGIQGAGTVHHVAWASPAEEHEAWRERVIAAGHAGDAR